MWQDLFSYMILERDYEYFKDGLVKEVYQVDNKVYAKGRKKCKHMAALLFEVLGGEFRYDE